MILNHTLKAALSCAALLVYASPASAQFARNSKAPITASADNAGYKGDVTTLSGQVDVRQDDVRILADLMKIYSARSEENQEGLGDISRIEAIGNFFYITPEQEVSGTQGIYESRKNNFTVTGNVILLQGDDNVVTGDELVYNLTTNQATVTGSCNGRKCGDKGRVNILIKSNEGDRP
ncbi:MAG: LptA/OstA family protein [Maricaulaceae bacterium]